MTSRVFFVVFEALLVIAAYSTAFLLRLDFSPNAGSRMLFLLSLPWVLYHHLADLLA